MKENVQKEEGGVSLLEILRLLLSKIKLLFLVVIAAGIVGGSFALYTSWNSLYFGTRVEFYVNPEKPKVSTGEGGTSQFGVYGAYGRHVMDNMVKLLESESFTEQLLLNGETLPEITITGVGKDDAKYPVVTPLGEVLEEGDTWSWIPQPTTEDRAAAAGTDKVFAYDVLKEALDEARFNRAVANGMLSEFEAKVLLKTEQTQTFNQLSVDLATIWRKLYVNKIVEHSSFWENEYLTLKADHKASYISQDVEELINTYDAVETAKQDLKNVQAEIDALNETYFKAADAAEKKALDLWRATSRYKSILKMYSKAVGYSYLEANVDIDDANNLARSFIYVNISVVGEENQEFAKELHARVKEIVPAFVKDNMTVPADYEGTNCERITRTDEIHRTNPNYRSKQVIKFALLFAAAALVIAAVIVIVIDKSDKRLRDTEIITKKFNVPILGIVPSIEELHEETNAKKNGATKKNTKEAK